MSTRRFWTIAAALMLAMTAIEAGAMLGDSQANDESYHLLAGYKFLKTGSIGLVQEHPPLAEAVAAAPLLALGLRLPHPEAIQTEREHEFIYGNRYGADTILLWARSAALLWVLALGGLMAWWTRRHFGPAPALAAVTLLAFDPAFLSHGHYTDNDVPVAFCFLAAVIGWNAFLGVGSMPAAAICGALTGVAMATKYSSLVLFPIFVLLYGVSWWRQTADPAGPRFRHSLLHLTKSMLVLVGAMLLVVFAAFRFEMRPLIPGELMRNPEPISAKLVKHAQLLGGMAPAILNHPDRLKLLDTALQQTPLPAPSFIRGLLLVTRHGTTGGHPTYLLGRYSLKGWWYYFPVVIAVKTPIGLLALFVLAAVLAARGLFGGGWQEGAAKLKGCDREWYAVAVPPIFYFLVSVQSHINIGVRHLLPIYPFVFIWMAAATLGTARVAAPRWTKVAALGCIGLAALESLSAFPNYLGFFNVPSGGTHNGIHYVVDSNLDWGQDMKRLRAYLSSRQIASPCVSYFGMAAPEDYGLATRPVPASLAAAEQAGCGVVIMSSTQLAFDGGGERNYQWLREFTPTDFVGSSFRVYRIPGAGQ